MAPQEEALITADLPSWGAMVQPGWLDALLDVFMVDADVEDDELDTLCAHTGPELVITELNPGDAQAFSCSALHQLDFVIPDQQQSALDSQEYAWQDAAARARRLLEGDRNRNMGGEISQALELCESDRARPAATFFVSCTNRFTPRDILPARTITVFSAAFATAARSSSLSPVVPITCAVPV